MMSLPKNDLKKQDILEKIAQKFEVNKIYNEIEVNEIINSFDVDDHVLIRRELINFGYLQRDPYKGTYWLLKKKLTDQELSRIGKNQQKINEMD